MAENPWFTWLRPGSPLRPVLDQADQRLVRVANGVDSVASITQAGIDAINRSSAALTSTLQASTEQLSRTVRDASQDQIDAIRRSAQDTVSAIDLQTNVLHHIASMVRDNLVQIEGLLDGMLRALRNPLATAAEERLRRGVRAISQGWIDDAVEELTESIASDKYVPVAHLYLGLALERIGNRDDAEREYALAVKYGPDDAALTARAALLYIAGLATHDPSWLDESVVVHTVRSRSIPCPELFLTMGSATHNLDDLQNAVELAPDLLLDMHFLDPERADEIQRLVEMDPNSTYCTALKVIDGLQGVVGKAPDSAMAAHLASLLAPDWSLSSPGRFATTGGFVASAPDLWETCQRLVHEQKALEEEIASAKEGAIRLGNMLIEKRALAVNQRAGLTQIAANLEPLSGRETDILAFIDWSNQVVELLTKRGGLVDRYWVSSGAHYDASPWIDEILTAQGEAQTGGSSGAFRSPWDRTDLERRLAGWQASGLRGAEETASGLRRLLALYETVARLGARVTPDDVACRYFAATNERLTIPTSTGKSARLDSVDLLLGAAREQAANALARTRSSIGSAEAARSQLCTIDHELSMLTAEEERIARVASHPGDPSTVVAMVTAVFSDLAALRDVTKRRVSAIPVL